MPPNLDYERAAPGPEGAHYALSHIRHLFPKHWDAIDPESQVHSVSEVQGLGVWTGIGHHAAAPQSVDHLDLRPGFSTSSPSVFPDH
jgi:hypothetical protein